MNGTGRPYENSTINTAILPLVHFFAQGMCLYLLKSGFSVGLPRAKTTEVWAKEGLCAQVSRQLPPPVAYRELYERRGETVRKPDHKHCRIAVSLFFLHKACAYTC